MNIRSQRLPLAAHIAMALALTLLAGSSTALAAKKPAGGGGSGGTTTKPPTPMNFRVTGKTAYSISVAWDAASSSTPFNFYLSGTSQAPGAILPSTARSHTFTPLAPGNEYWLFIYTKDGAGNPGGQAQVTTRTLLDTTAPWTAPVVSIGTLPSIGRQRRDGSES